MQADAARTPKPPPNRIPWGFGKRSRQKLYSLITLRDVDRRTLSYRRARALADDLEAKFGGQPLTSEVMALIERAAGLEALATDARSRLVGGDHIVTHNDVCRLDRQASLARREVERLLRKRPKRERSVFDGLPLPVDEGDA
jgi:hypothetical protein